MPWFLRSPGAQMRKANGLGAGRGGACGRSQPAASQARGTENSLHPQSMQMRTSGDGVTGGWLRVRGPSR